MNKFYLSAKSFNALQRDPDGAKVQRIWTNEFRGLGVDLGLTKKSVIHKFKSPESGKYRIIVLDSYSYEQVLSEDLIDRIVSDYYQVKDKIRAGVDPLAVKDEERQARQEAEVKAAYEKAEEEHQTKQNAYTLNRAFDAYTAHRLFTSEISHGTQSAYMTCYNKHIRPILGKTPLSDIEPHQVNNFLDSLGDSACNMSIAILMRIQKIAMRAGKITSPFIFDTDRRTVGKRTRTIDDLPKFLAWLQDTRTYQSYKNGVHSQLLYGTRAGEMYGLKWSEVDEENLIINISWERVKNRRIALKQFEPLQLPVMPAMVDILQQQKMFISDYVFPQLTDGLKPVNNSQIHYLLNHQAGFKLSSHDIRRTVATLLRNKLEASMDDIDLVLDHSIGAVNQSYVHGTPLEMKRRILSKWHTYLTELASTGVTTLKPVKGGV